MSYRGVLIQESLENPEILSRLLVYDTQIFPVTPNDNTPWLKQWTLKYFEIEAHEAEDLAVKLSGAIDSKHANAWYIDYRNESTHFIIFRDKVFRISPIEENNYTAALHFARKLGIPESQLDFVPKDTDVEQRD